MLNEFKKYMSAARTAADLAFTMGSVPNRVPCGELKSVRAQGGHWRISTSSMDERRQAHHEQAPAKSGKICILHQGDDLDPLLLEKRDTDQFQLMSHPLELLGLDLSIGVLFIDARFMLFQTTPQAMIDRGLQKKYEIYIYNTQVLPEYCPIFRIPDLRFVPSMVNAHFISGYAVAQQAKTMQRRALSTQG